MLVLHVPGLAGIVGNQWQYLGMSDDIEVASLLDMSSQQSDMQYACPARVQIDRP